MIYLPVSILLFLVLLMVLPFLALTLTVDVVADAAGKLAIAPWVAIVLLAAIVIGGTINIPLYRIESTVESPLFEIHDPWLRQFWGLPLAQVERTTVVALNVGGGLIPVLLGIYQFTQAPAVTILLVTAIVTLVSYFASQVVPGIGIQINPLLPPLTAALTSSLLASHAAPIAFAGGVLGTLIGADLLHLKEIQSMSPGVLSIGGAGVFDGIALCGLFALLLS
jgi:uncharacterized membrane protein